ncbi:hypothetical protein [Paenibacillus humicola]|uniref:hypothetical protein n=1 Tax=Paenibacillus humicola TaxID=3110540 RepID=UPI00237B57E6|nr:hypothetical protein [Paenibacillus humicola]
MRKKWLAAGAGIGVGAVMLFASGFSAMADTSGSDAYKSALLQTKAETSLTADADLTITDNGTKLLSGTANIKLNRESQSASLAAEIGSGTQTHAFQVYRQDGKTVFKSGDSDVYRIMQSNEPDWQHGGGDHPAQPPKAVEQLFDTLTGNVRQLATVETEADGSKIASLHLTESQIPAVVNAIGSLAASGASGGKWHHAEGKSGGGGPFGPAEFDMNLPKLTDEIRVDSINLDAKITPDNLLDEQTAEIGISGKDDSGTLHDLVVRLHVDFSGYNQTNPERIDLTGKPTETIQNKGPGRGGWHH